MPDGRVHLCQGYRSLSLLRDVDRTCERLIELEKEKSDNETARLDLLAMSHADLHFGSRKGTLCKDSVLCRNPND